MRLDVGHCRCVLGGAAAGHYPKRCAPLQEPPTLVCVSGSWEARIADDADAVGHRIAAPAAPYRGPRCKVRIYQRTATTPSRRKKAVSETRLVQRDACARGCCYLG